MKQIAEIPKETIEFFKDTLRARVFIQKYAQKNSKREILEKTPIQMWERLASALSEVENEKDREIWKEKFFYLLKDFKFIPGGRIMFAVGNQYTRAVPINCFVIPIKEDSIEGIFEALKESARTYAMGGGVGISLSILRPKNSRVNNSALTSTGAVSFMELFSQTTGTIGQEGRRGAMILTLHDCHPDIEDFIVAKADPEKKAVRFANISVSISDDFMKAVISDSDWELWYADKSKTFTSLEELEAFKSKNPSIPILENGYTWYEVPSETGEWILMTPFSKSSVAELRKKKVYKTIKAKNLWNKIIKSNWESAEPGILFRDRQKNYSPTQSIFPTLTVNPCGEQVLGPYECCDLGSFNLSAYVKFEFSDQANVDLETLYNDVMIAVRFLDNVIDYAAQKNLFPLEAQKEAALKTRRIGIGVTGLADMLAKLRIPYDSDEALKVVDEVLKTIKRAAYYSSSLLAKEKGAFVSREDLEKYKAEVLLDPNNEWFMNLKKDLSPEEWKSILDNGLRNSALLTIPPVGSGSLLAGVSSGIEPIFFLSYIRRFESLDTEEVKSFHPLYKHYLDLYGSNKSDEVEVEVEVPEFFKTAHEIDPFYRIRMQEVASKHIDASISGTINLPEESSVEEISRLYLEAWKRKLKGITTYREGSRKAIIEESKRDDSHQTASLSLSLSSEIPSPIELSGKRFKFKIAEEGTRKANCWVSIFGDKEPREIFITVGKSGTTLNSLVEALGRAISLGLRRGVPAKDYVEGLSGIKAQRVRQEDSTFIDSIPDGVAKALWKYLEELNGTAAENKVFRPQTSTTARVVQADLCPECGELLTHENGCMTCFNCGYSRCE